MTERINHLKTRLSNARAYLDAVLDQVGDRWETQVYSDGLAWTVRQIVVHLAEADKGHNYQVMNIAEGREVIPEDFDVERFNRRTTEKTMDKTAAQARAELDENRQQLNAWLDTLDEAKLDHEGRHASLEVMSVERILKLMAVHERTHALDIAQALKIEV